MIMKIISYSLWGTNQLYYKGIQPNLELAKEIYPGWMVRLYVDRDVTKEAIDLVEKFGGQVEQITYVRSFWHGLFWRFYPAADDTIERFICRDLDSRLNVREKAAVDDWVASGKKLHVMRDHKHHGYPIPGGMWGCVGGFIPNMRELVRSWGDVNAKGCDQRFLKTVVWDKVKNDSLAHDNFFHGRFGGLYKPFPSHPPYKGFVGEIIR